MLYLGFCLPLQRRLAIIADQLLHLVDCLGVYPSCPGTGSHEQLPTWQVDQWQQGIGLSQDPLNLVSSNQQSIKKSLQVSSRHPLSHVSGLAVCNTPFWRSKNNRGRLHRAGGIDSEGNPT